MTRTISVKKLKQKAPQIGRLFVFLYVGILVKNPSVVLDFGLVFQSIVNSAIYPSGRTASQTVGIGSKIVPLRELPPFLSL